MGHMKGKERKGKGGCLDLNSKDFAFMHLSN